MKEVYVHTLRYHFYGRANRKSRTMHPFSYGPFRDEDAAREWIRQSGITYATKLMGHPATENIKLPPKNLPPLKNGDLGSLVDAATQPGAMM